MPNIIKRYDEDVSEVEKIQFSILNASQIKNTAVCKVYNTFSDTKNLEGTLSDPRMGTIDNRKKCISCENEYKNCPGHHGYLELAEPMFNIIYMKILIKVLNSVCYHCSSVILPLEEEKRKLLLDLNKKLSNKAKLLQIVKSCASIKSCYKCKASTVKYTKNKTSFVLIDRSFKEKEKEKDKDKQAITKSVTAKDVLEILTRITDADSAIIGLNPEYSRPENMILTILLIPPPCMRPSVKTDNGKTSEDDLTHKYNDIIKCNNDLYNAIASDSSNRDSNSDISKKSKLLQYHIITLIDNNISKIPKATHKNGGRPMKSLRERVAGKDGRFRNSLMGKRVDKSGRSVITPDPTLSIDEVGVPEEIANNLTYPDIVNSHNIKFLTALIRSNKAKSILRLGESNRINLTLDNIDKNKIVLHYGDKVYRHLLDGDWVLFNRQPSLHKMSMMGHRVRVMKGRTYRINANVTNPYNADFDGDEMNMHTPQSIETVCELKFLASVENQIVSPQSSKPVISPVQDSLLGAYLLSKQETVPYYYYYSIISKLYNYDDYYVQTYIDYVLNSAKISSEYNTEEDINDYLYNYVNIPVKYILSGIMPPINYLNENDDGKGNKKVYLRIENGQIIEGNFSNKSLGSSKGSLIHIIFLDCGPKTAMDFINNIGIIAINYLKIIGFSCGYRDIVISNELHNRINNSIDDLLNNCNEFIRKVKICYKSYDENKHVKEDYAIYQDETIYVNELLKRLLKGRSEIEKYVVNNIKENNNIVQNGIYTMVECGSKGKLNNIAQIVALLSQQEVDGTWIENEFNRRTLPHFPKDDISPVAHGYVRNSFSSGLTPTEYYFHAGSGREGVINKTIKTADTGYVQRKFIKALEDLHCCEDGTIRNANDIIIQYCFGVDGCDPVYHELQDIPYVNWNTAHLFMECGYDELNEINILRSVTNIQSKDNTSLRNLLDNEYLQIENIYKYVKSINRPYNISKSLCPVNFERMIETYRSKFNITDDTISDLSPEYVISEVNNKLINNFRVCKDMYVNSHVTRIMKLLTRIHLCTKNIILRKRFTKASFDSLIYDIYSKFIISIMTPGENIGTITAQSLGEPTTQLSLDSFHNIGFDSDGPKGGLQRLVECINISTSIKNPMMIIYLKDGLSDKAIKTISQNIRYVIFKDIISNVKLLKTDNSNEVILDIKYDQLKVIEHRLTLSTLMKLYNKLNADKKAYLLDKDINSIHFEEINDDNFLNGIKFKIVGVSELNELRDTVNSIMAYSIKGVPNVSQSDELTVNIPLYIDDELVNPDKLDKNMSDNMSFINKTKVKKIRTIGNNLPFISTINGIDMTKTISNDIWEMYVLFGVEVARNCIMNEVNGIFSDSLNPVHTALLADTMTNEGILVSIDRHGANKTESGPLGRATFEETMIQLTNASIYSDCDNIKGVSANVMFGQNFKSGTGGFTINVDLDKMFALNSSDDIYIPDELKYDVEVITTDFDMSLLSFNYQFY